MHASIHKQTRFIHPAHPYIQDSNDKTRGKHFREKVLSHPSTVMAAVVSRSLSTLLWVGEGRPCLADAGRNTQP